MELSPGSRHGSGDAPEVRAPRRRGGSARAGGASAPGVAGTPPRISAPRPEHFADPGGGARRVGSHGGDGVRAVRFPASPAVTAGAQGGDAWSPGPPSPGRGGPASRRRARFPWSPKSPGPRWGRREHVFWEVGGRARSPGYRRLHGGRAQGADGCGEQDARNRCSVNVEEITSSIESSKPLKVNRECFSPCVF